MSATTLVSVEEYLNSSYEPDCDYVDGELLERNVGNKRHGYAQSRICIWFGVRETELDLVTITEMRMRLTPTRVRIPDVVVCELPLPEEDVFTSPPYLCIEIMSPDDTVAGVQSRLDDYLAFGVPNVWVIDPPRRLGWRVTHGGWAAAVDGVMRTGDGRVAMPLNDVLLRA